MTSDRLDTNELFLEIAKGNVAVHRHMWGFGEHTFGTDSNVDVWGGPTDQQPEPDTGGFALFVESDSIEDDIDKGGEVPGTGARIIEVHYLDTAGAEQSVTVTMNGTTPVDSGVSDCMFVQEHHVTTVGTNLVSVGNVDCTSASGGAVVSRITATGNQSMSTMRQVPAGKTLYVECWSCEGTATTTKIANLRLRTSTHDDALNAGVYHFRDSARVKDSAVGPIPAFFKCPALSTIKISGWTTGTIDCTARWSGILVNN